MKSPHPSSDEWMSYLYAETPPEAREAMSDHLQRCPDCRTSVTAWQQSLTDLNVWKLPTRDRKVHWMRTVRWAAAAVILLSASFAVGRSSAHDARRQASLDKQWASKLEATRLQMEEKWRREQSEMFRRAGAEISNLCRNQTQETLTALTEELLQKSAGENARVMEALQRVDSQRATECAVLRKGLEMVAVLTEAGFQEAQQRLTHLASHSPTEPNR